MTEESSSTPAEAPSSERSVEDLRYVVDASDLPRGERIITDIDGREIAVFNIRDEYHAVANYCVHQGGPVCEGLVAGALNAKREGDDWELVYESDDEILSCPWHGWEFDIPTGEHLARTKYRLPTYDVVERDGRVYLDV